MIYVDYAATAPMSEQAIATYEEIAKRFYGNPSSPHDEGTSAKQILENARGMIADCAGVPSEGIYFTGSGTEANLIAILSISHANAQQGKHIITSAAEHTSVHAAMNVLEKEGFRITRLPLDKNGLVSVEKIRNEISKETILISVQHVNPEIGTIQPIEKIARLAKQHGVRCHVDCVQSFTKLPLEHFATIVDAMTFSAHKVGGPKGCGAVYIHPKCKVAPLFPGLTHEGGLRGGTVDVPGVAAFAVAAVESKEQTNIPYLSSLRNALKGLLENSPYQFVEAPSTSQYPAVCGMRMNGLEGQYIMLRLNQRGIYLSTGSACDSFSATGTKAIMAMGYPIDKAKQFFRISFSRQTRMENIEQLAGALIDLSKEFEKGKDV
ncbi:cysteine desulfurase family protein [Rummeliibacillus sp. JY-2-4R]